MNDKINILKDLIEESKVTTQMKLNRIIQTLQRTEDPIKARLLSAEILKGEFGDLEEQSIDDLILAFNGNNREAAPNLGIPQTEAIINKGDSEDTNKTMNLEYEIRRMKDQLDKMVIKNEELEKSTKLQLEAVDLKNRKLQETNNKLIESLSLTKNSELITVSDEDINKLYIQYIQNEETACNKVAKMSGRIVKSYYNVK